MPRSVWKLVPNLIPHIRPVSGNKSYFLHVGHKLPAHNGKEVVEVEATPAHIGLRGIDFVITNPSGWYVEGKAKEKKSPIVGHLALRRAYRRRKLSRYGHHGHLEPWQKKKLAGWLAKRKRPFK